MTLKPAMNSSNRCFLMASCSRRLLSRWDVTWSNSDTRAKYASSCTRTTWKLSTTHSEKPTTYQNKRTTPATLNNTTRTVPRHQKTLCMNLTPPSPENTEHTVMSGNKTSVHLITRGVCPKHSQTSLLNLCNNDHDMKLIWSAHSDPRSTITLDLRI